MRLAPIRFFALLGILVGVGFRSAAQCPEVGVNESLYGTNGWNGYVYDGLNTFASNVFLGTKNEATEFNETFATGQTDGGCVFALTTFSVRFKNRQDFLCGLHTFTVTSNNVARLSIDGGNTFLINVASGTGSATLHLTGGTYELVLEYVHNTGSPQISFDFDFTPGDDAGLVSGDQVVCDSPADPVAFTSSRPARFCSELPASYQWEVSINGGVYTAITGATSVTYDVRSGVAAGNYLYRRRATDGTTTIYSNEISVVVGVPEGNQSSFGTTSWLAYAYEGADNYNSDSYLGYFEESALNFAETFDAVTMNGCDLPAEGFTVRFKRQETIASCDGYDITVQAQGGGARLYVDGVLVIDGYAPVAALTSYSANILLTAGLHEFILEYYNNEGANYLEFDLAATGVTGGGGVIGMDQEACGAPYDPPAFTSIKPAEFCSGAVSYQWQSAPSDTGPWSNISGTSETFDEGSLGVGTYYYRRAATVGGTTVYSNVIEVDVKQPAGDPAIYPSGSWRGYAYDGFDDFSLANYLGYFDIASLNFTEDFSAVALAGCDLPEENFSVRFRREEARPCGGYTITLTADDQLRFYLDGVQLTNGYTSSYSGEVYLDGGNHLFAIEFTAATGPKNVSFTITPTGAASSGGLIGYDQDICSPTRDPAPFLSLADAGYCSGPQTYEWQIADNPGGPWTPLPSSNSSTYDSPPLPVGVHYFRRMYTDGNTQVFSNVLEVSAYTPVGDGVTYGDNEWIGYVYDREANWTDDFKGSFRRSTNFDESFCAGLCEFLPEDGCPVEATEFSVLFRNRADFECGSYLITIGGDDGVSLVVDGTIVPELDRLTQHPYTTYSKVMYFNGTPDTELDLYYFESAAGNRVSFSAVFLGPGNAGTIGGEQYYCEAGVTPTTITSVEEATSCTGSPFTYQWQVSLDGLGWTDIPGENGSEYTPPAPIDITHYYRRQVTMEGYTWSSNVITVTIDPPQGDQVTYGQNEWIGYVYTGFQDTDPWNASAYQGYMVQPTNFDTPFCGPSCRHPINGCDFETDFFSIRFLNEMTLECGYYDITIGFNGGGRLYIDGVIVPGLNEYWIHDPYETRTARVFLTQGTHQFRYEYWENDHGNRVSFNIEYVGAGTPAVINRSQVMCLAPYDPDFLSVFIPPDFECSGDLTPTYQWQVSTDGTTWSDIPLANSSTYDPPPGHTFTRQYRLKATDDLGSELYSEPITIAYDTDPPPYTGVEYGLAPQWIGHVYDGAMNFTTNYQGSFIEPTTFFDESFCGPNCIFPLDGCDILTTTFSVRFRTQIDLPAGSYTFTVGSEEGARLTIEGEEIVSPLTIIDDFASHPYRTVVSSPVDLLGGTYFLVLDFYDQFSSNRISFSYTSVPLPVTWHYFNGYYADGKSFLEWHTASEVNNEGFEIQHSTNGVHFVNIGWVDGHGTTNVANEYQFVHQNPVEGWNYYRLKQVDYDGKFEYSRLIPVYADNLPGVEIYPNPLKENRLFLSRVNTDQPIQVTITNMLGQDPIELPRDPMLPTCFILPNGVASGIYHVRIRMGDAVHTRKLIIP